jgi:hypothetical protein
VVALNLVAGGIGLVGSFGNPIIAVSVALVVIQALALWRRRSQPVAVLVVVLLAQIPAWMILPERDLGPALAFAVYAVAVYDRTRVRTWVAGAPIAIILAALVLILLGNSASAGPVLLAGGTSLVAWVIGARARLGDFARSDFARARRHELPGVIALAAIAALEIFGGQFILLSDQVNSQGTSIITEGRWQPSFEIGLAGIFLPVVIVAWLLGKKRPVRILFMIAIWFALLNTAVLAITVLATINLHSGTLGGATLLADAGLIWFTNVVVFALWYWSIDSGGPQVRGTEKVKRSDFLFSQQRHEIGGWEGWVPGFHDYLHAAFVISLTFHSAGAEVLSARAKYVNMLQAGVSVTTLLLIVAKAMATLSGA